MLESFIVFVTGDKDNLKFLGCSIHIVVELSEDGSESSARGAPI